MRELRRFRTDRPAELVRVVRERLPIVDGTRAEVEQVEQLLSPFGVVLDVAKT